MIRKSVLRNGRPIPSDTLGDVVDLQRKPPMQTRWCKLNMMKVLTYEATVERGEVKLPATVKLPEHAKVYVVVPGAEDLQASMIRTPHLLRPEQVADFAMEIVEGEDAAVR